MKTYLDAYAPNLCGGKTKYVVDSWNDFTTTEQAMLPDTKLEDSLGTDSESSREG